VKKLTDTLARAALRNPPKARNDVPDGTVPGLTLRLGPQGSTWSLVLRVVGEGGTTPRGHQRKGRRQRVSLGEYPQVSIQAARSLANAYLDQAKKGVSPIAALESVATAGGLNVKALAEKFIDDYVRLKELRALNKYQGAVRVHITPLLGGVLADTVTREQVRGLVKKAMVRVPRGKGPRDRPHGGKEAARSALAVLRKMINWGIRERLLKRIDNPATGMEDNLPKKRQKERVLSLEEARLAWCAAQSLGYPFGPTYQLILLTGCRPGEWSACLKSYVDLNQSLLVIPADAYKSNHVHVVPLVPRAATILGNTLDHHSGNRGEYIFSGTDGEKPLSGWTKGHARMMRAICALSGERPAVRWTPHDLRRTVATRIAEKLGVGGEQLIQRVLGHSDGSVTAIYNRYGYVREMRVVLEQWATDLTTDGSKITVLPGIPSAFAPIPDSAASRSEEAAA
jgi:integrase